MKVIVLVHADGSERMTSAPVPDNFDIQAWASRRLASLHMLGVVAIREDIYQKPTEIDDGMGGHYRPGVIISLD